MEIDALMDRRVSFCYVQDTLADAADKLEQCGADSLAVCDEYATVVGMVDTRAICMGAYCTGLPLSDILVCEVLINEFSACRSDETVDDVAQRFAGLALDRIPVLDHADRLVGEISCSCLRSAAGSAQPLARRVEASNEPHGAADAFPGWTLLTERREIVSPTGDVIRLTSGECRLLSAFMDVAGRTVDRDHLMWAICNRPWDPTDRYIDVLVGALRKKLGERAANARLIRTVHGVGYRFDARVLAGIASEAEQTRAPACGATHRCRSSMVIGFGASIRSGLNASGAPASPR